MILQALQRYYDRLADDPASGVARPGYSEQKITFIVVLNSEGTLHEIKDGRREEITILRNGKQKTDLRATLMIVPGGEKPSGRVTPSSVRKKAGYLWNDSSYLLGVENTNGKLSANSFKFEAFRENHLGSTDRISDPSFTVLCSFLRSWDPVGELRNSSDRFDPKLLAGFGIFQIRAHQEFIHQRPEVVKWWEEKQMQPSRSDSILCLVTGKPGPLARKHEPKIKGVAAPNPPAGGGHLLVSFNEPAFCSYGKEQGANAPVSTTAAFAYCNALNRLLGRDRQRLQIGDCTTIFWADQPRAIAGEVPADELISFLLDTAQQQPQDDALKQRVEKVLERAAQGLLDADDLGDAATPFYILGLSPNASRLSVRYWLNSTLGDITHRLQRHIRDLHIVRQWDEGSIHPDPLIPSVWQLLRQTAREAKDIPPLLGGAVMQAILGGGKYPDALAAAIHRRIKADRDINYLRASALKAWLIRNHAQPMKSALDKDNPNIAYQLGRLFAVFEQTQRKAHDFQLERTIRETFFTAACSTPIGVFARLHKLHVHHLRKLNKGSQKFFEDLVLEIEQKIQSPLLYPPFLGLKDQSGFAVGYYHQMHTLKHGEQAL